MLRSRCWYTLLILLLILTPKHIVLLKYFPTFIFSRRPPTFILSALSMLYVCVYAIYIYSVCVCSAFARVSVLINVVSFFPYLPPLASSVYLFDSDSPRHTHTHTNTHASHNRPACLSDSACLLHCLRTAAGWRHERRCGVSRLARCRSFVLSAAGPGAARRRKRQIHCNVCRHRVSRRLYCLIVVFDFGEI